MIENPSAGSVRSPLPTSPLWWFTRSDSATRSEPVAAFILGRQVAFTLDKQAAQSASVGTNNAPPSAD